MRRVVKSKSRRNRNSECRAIAFRYLKNGQFEIVSGGWVMTDEANAHLYSIVMEAFEGHEFIKNQMGMPWHEG